MDEGSDPKITSDKYSLHSCDLNDLNNLRQVLKEAKLDPEAPTLILSECVLVYLEPEAVRGVIECMSGTFPRSVFMDYEMFNPSTSFGQMMVKNFKERGVPLVSIDNFRNLDEIQEMYVEGGYQTCEARDVQTIFTQYLPKQELQRIRKLEWLDELEQIALIQSHYFISIARQSRTGPGEDPEPWFEELGLGAISK
jgi:O-methyltransferase involved in polyketide biosynthesis